MSQSFKVIGTGSKGNCYLLTAGEDKLLIECGVSIKDILKGIEFNFVNIKGCLITHSHKDHCKAFKEVLNYGIDIYTSEGSVAEMRQDKHHRIHIIKDKQKFNIENFKILAFKIEHDTSEPLGFLIGHKDIGKLLFVTDSYYLKYKFPSVDHIIIECNYSESLVEGLNDNELRLLKSHMSLETLKKTLSSWDLKSTKDITLIHLSERHGDTELFKTEIEKVTGKTVNVAYKGGKYEY